MGADASAKLQAAEQEARARTGAGLDFLSKLEIVEQLGDGSAAAAAVPAAAAASAATAEPAISAAPAEPTWSAPAEVEVVAAAPPPAEPAAAATKPKPPATRGEAQAAARNAANAYLSLSLFIFFGKVFCFCDLCLYFIF